MEMKPHIVYHTILEAQAKRKTLLAVLLDPDKVDMSQELIMHLLHAEPIARPDLIFIGGSTASSSESLVRFIKHHTTVPVVLFPGNPKQFTPQADALLFLSLLNSTNYELLIGQHIQVAQQVHQSGIEVLPMGYILVDGGNQTSVIQVTHATPLANTDGAQIAQYALAAQLLGKQLVYLEAGSGARTPIPPSTIQHVRKTLSIPLIVGGGIDTIERMQTAAAAGADVVVIGNYFEHNPQMIPHFAKALHQS